MATFADRFKQLREESGLTQEELARRLGVSKGTVGNYESGARTPRKLDDLNSLADSSMTLKSSGLFPAIGTRMKIPGSASSRFSAVSTREMLAPSPRHNGRPS